MVYLRSWVTLFFKSLLNTAVLLRAFLKAG